MTRLFPVSSAAVLALLALGLAGQAVARAAEKAKDSPAVVELFTSQGCSSCPPADALLGRLAARPDIIALSFSVDYWDYLGWRDTLGSPVHSERQRGYARSRGDGRVYTPQMVVDGVEHVNGADEGAVREAISKAKSELAKVKVPIEMRRKGDALLIDIGAAPSGSERRAATIWLILAKKLETVEVTRGENRGRELSYHHAVRELMPIAMWRGEAMTLQLPLTDLTKVPGVCLFALLQVENSGPVIGAAEFTP